MKLHPKHLKTSIKSKIRNKAISRSETRILLAGRKVSDFSEEELEVIVREEEDKIYSSLKEKGLLAAIAVLGIGWWV
jgi:CRISPR/Cas system-associated protein Csx1